MLSCVVLFQYCWIPVHTSHSAAREKRQCYTLGSISDVTDASSRTLSIPATPSHSRNLPAIPVSHPPLTIGPDRSRRVTRQARLKAGHLPPRPKEQISTNGVGVAPLKAVTALIKSPTEGHSAGNPAFETPSAVTPIVEIPFLTALQVDTLQPQVDASTASPSGAVEPNVISTPNHLSDTTTSVPDDCASNSGSYTSTLPEVFNDMMDDSGPPATGPWVAIDHLTGEMIVDDDDPTGAVPASTQSTLEIGILPCLGIHILTETEPPVLLFEDEDVRPEWLISAVKEFLRYTPYYGHLGKVIDLFLAQEARLRYPNLVIDLYSLRITRTNTIPSPHVEPFPPAIGPSRWASSRSGPESILVVTTWTLRGSARPSSSGGSPSNQPRGSNGRQLTIHLQMISHSTTSIAVDPTVCF